MPNRTIREGILSSSRIAQLTWGEEVFFRRLLSIIDDYGLYENRPDLIRVKCYPIQLDSITTEEVAKHIESCVSIGLIIAYQANGREYIMVPNFNKTMRSSPKCPLPHGYEVTQISKTCFQLQSIANNCNQLQTIENNCSQLHANDFNCKQLQSKAKAKAKAKANITTTTTCEREREMMRGTNSTPVDSDFATTTFARHELDLVEASLTPESTSTPPPCLKLPANDEEAMRYMQAQSFCLLTAEELSKCATKFFDSHEESGWTNRFGHPITNWQASARTYLAKWTDNTRKQTPTTQNNDDFTF